MSVNIYNLKSESISNKSLDIEKKADIQDNSVPRSCVRSSRSYRPYQNENNLSASKSKSGRKKAIKHRTTVTLKEVTINDNTQFDSLKSQKSKDLQNVEHNHEGKEEIKFQLLRPEELNRKESWHSYVNKSRSPNYILCRFQIKERKIFQERSEEALIKKVRFYKIVEVKKVTGNSKDRRGYKKSKTRNPGVKIWFTGITGMNTINNKKPEENPIAANIVWEDRTCDIHIIDPSEDYA
ncbi:hypothetical protein RclHR1_02760008 [Rhizophagus clarus]|uniref:Uncharacterized protein n=1 Tax=Rhizophagus clarus TaxID=94130 RepID=A0A2Z6R382_9GLOM|nr:hypothetical protein RclHR1_02760008 [Rhizophagus clarus]GES91899.1 hypothetical protein GLOIN_2v1686023 [Rhizophagus clarus]